MISSPSPPRCSRKNYIARRRPNVSCFNDSFLSSVTQPNSIVMSSRTALNKKTPLCGGDSRKPREQDVSGSARPVKLIEFLKLTCKRLSLPSPAVVAAAQEGSSTQWCSCGEVARCCECADWLSNQIKGALIIPCIEFPHQNPFCGCLWLNHLTTRSSD